VRAVTPAVPVAPVERPAKAAPPVKRHAVPEKAHGAPRHAKKRVVRVPRPQVRTPAVARGGQVRPVDHARHHRAIDRHPAPLQAPDRSGTHSVTCGGVPIGAATGLPTVFPWAPVPPRACVPRAFGAVPPAVRTAADEPSFAPD
jgi:hypothetical protein